MTVTTTMSPNPSCANCLHAFSFHRNGSDRCFALGCKCQGFARAQDHDPNMEWDRVVAALPAGPARRSRRRRRGRRSVATNPSCMFCRHPASFHGSGAHPCRASGCRCEIFKRQSRSRHRPPALRSKRAGGGGRPPSYEVPDRVLFPICPHLRQRLSPYTKAAAGLCSYWNRCQNDATHLALDAGGHVLGLCAHHQSVSPAWTHSAWLRTPCPICRVAPRA